jgi:hypothetical protein
MPVKIVDWPVIDYNNQSVAVPETKKPGQTGASPVLDMCPNADPAMRCQLIIAMVRQPHSYGNKY